MLRILTVIGCILIPLYSLAAEQAEDRDAMIIQALTDLSAQLPQQYLSLEAVADHNDYEADKIIAWVGRNIQYSPSPGYQLTPENALLTTSGNALEQAMLLQNVLTLAGFEVRIARAELDEQTANELLKQSFFESPANQWAFSDEIREQSLRKFATLYGEEENTLVKRYQELAELTPWNKSKLYEESKSLSQTLYSAIEEQDAWQLPDNALKPWVEIAEDYYFVKYRLAQGDEWLQAHPAFVENAPNIETSTYFTDDIANQLHRITLQAFITRQLDGNKIETIAVTPLIERNSQQLFDNQLTFITAPSNFKEALDANNLELFYESKFFIPFVNDELDEKTRAFTLDGKDYSAKEVLGSTQQFISSVKDNTSKAASTLGELANQAPKTHADPSPQTTSVLLDYHFLLRWEGPSGDSRQIRRNIYQRRETESNKSVVEDITQRLLFAAEPGVLSPPAQSSQQLNAHISILQLMQKGVAQDFSEAQTINQLDQWRTSQKNSSSNNTLALSQQHHTNQQVLSSIPMLAVIWERQDYASAGPSGRTTFDYLINAAQIIAITEDVLRLDTSATLAFGVWSTYSEALVQESEQQDEELQSREIFPKGVMSAAGQFNLATTDGSEFTIVTNANELKPLLQLTSPAKTLLESDLTANPQYLYVLPKVRPKSGYLALYRVDRQTGETLGYSEFGRGATQAEYAKLVTATIASFKFGESLAKCNAMTGGAERRSCLFCSVALAAITANGLIRTSVAAVAVAAGAATERVCAPHL